MYLCFAGNVPAHEALDLSVQMPCDKSEIWDAMLPCDFVKT